jgi:hypothetical protein
MQGCGTFQDRGFALACNYFRIKRLNIRERNVPPNIPSRRFS